MKYLIVVIAAVIFPAVILAGQGYLDVTAPGNRQLQLAIPPSSSMDGAQNPEIVKELNDVLSFDMTLAGPFSVMSGAGGKENSSIRPGEFNFAPWKAAGADLLVKSGYRVKGKN